MASERNENGVVQSKTGGRKLEVSQRQEQDPGLLS